MLAAYTGCLPLICLAGLVAMAAITIHWGRIGRITQWRVMKPDIRLTPWLLGIALLALVLPRWFENLISVGVLTILAVVAIALALIIGCLHLFAPRERVSLRNLTGVRSTPIHDDTIYSPQLIQTTYSTDKIYIGDIFANNPLGQLTKNRYIEFTVRIYNGNDVEFSLAGVSGAVQCRQLGDQPHHVQPLDFADIPVLKPPDIKSLPAFRETTLAIWQHVPANIAENILKALNQSRGVQFNFEKLDIQLQDTASKTSIRLPLWDGIVLERGFRSKRLHSLTANPLIVKG